MPEESYRLVVKGIKRAESEFQKYVRFRIDAEKGTGELAKEMKELERATAKELADAKREQRERPA